MKRKIRWALASVGAAICIAATAVFSPSQSSCPVPTLVLVELALLGLAGFAAVALATKRSSPRWGAASWAVCGGLLALVFIGVWSVAPWVMMALLALVAAAMLGGRPESPRMLARLGILTLSAIVNFGLLFALAKDSGIEVVAVPEGSIVTQLFPAVDYADAYRASLPADPQPDLESITRTVLASLAPCWVQQRLRDKWEAADQDFAFQPGTATPNFQWTVYKKATNEIVVGKDQSHLDFRVSVLLSEENGLQWLTVSTLVRYNNWKGRAYFVPVRIGHQIILPHAVRTAVHHIREGTGAGAQGPGSRTSWKTWGPTAAAPW